MGEYHEHLKLTHGAEWLFSLVILVLANQHC